MRLPAYFRSGLLMVVACACAITGFAQELHPARPLAQLFPADTVLFVECPSVPAAIEKARDTGLWALWQDDSTKSIRLSLESQEGESTGSAPEVVGRFLEMVGSIKGGAAIGFSPADEGFEHLVVAQIGEREAAGWDFLNSLYAAEADRGMPPTRIQVSGVMVNISGVDGRHAAIVDGLLVMGSRYAVLGAIDRRNASSTAGSLSASTRFINAREVLAEGSGVLRAYLDFPELVERLKGEASDGVPFDLPGLIGMVGLDEIESVIMESGFDRSGVVDRIFVSMRSEDSRLLEMVGSEPFSERRLSVVPRDAVFFGARMSDPARLWDEALRLFRATSGDGGFDPDALTRRLQQSAGVNFRRDVIGSLGKAAIGYYRISASGDVMALISGAGLSRVTLVEVSNEAALREALRKIAAYAEADPEFLSPLAASGSRSARLEISMLGNQRVYSLVSGGAGGPSPSLTVGGGYLVCAKSRESLRAAFDRVIAPSASIADSAGYSRARSALAADVSHLAYFNLDHIIDIAYEHVLAGVGSEIDRAYYDERLSFSSADIPPAFRLKRHIDGIAMAATTNGSLIELQVYSPCGIAGLAGPAIIGIARANAARQVAAQPGLSPGESASADRQRLLKIGGLLHLATTTRHGRFPDTLEEAVAPEMLGAPRAGASTASSDYRYVKGRTIHSPARSILVYEREGIRADGRYVLYVDGRVEFLTEDDFQTAISR